MWLLLYFLLQIWCEISLGANTNRTTQGEECWKTQFYLSSVDRATTDAFRHSGFIFSDVHYLTVSASDSLAVFLY